MKELKKFSKKIKQYEIINKNYESEVGEKNAEI